MAALPENDRIAGPFTATAGQTDFPADFPLLKAEGLRVRLQRAGGTVTLSPPSVTPVDVVQSGFNARLTEAAQGGDLVWVYSELPAARMREHTPNGVVRSATLEGDAEEAQAQLQEVRRDLRRAVMVEVGEAQVSPPDVLEAARAIEKKADKVFALDTETIPIPLARRFAPYINTWGRGATGNGSTDDTAACQRAIDRALATGYRWEPEPGAIFRTTAPLVIDRSAVGSDFDRHKPVIRGGADGSTVFISDHGGACFDVRGGSDGGGHTPLAMMDLRIEGGNAPNSIGVKIDKAIYLYLARMTIIGMGYGLDGNDVLASTFDALKIRGNRRGFRFRRQAFSFPNANTFRDVIVGVNSEYGGLVEGAASFNWLGGTIEGNGSSETSWGLKMQDGGVEGAGGLTMVGVYAELNQGVADLWLTHPTQASSHTIIGGGFARGLADHYVNSNVKFDCAPGVAAHLWMGGVGFGTVGAEYVDDPSRPYVDLTGAQGAAWEVIDAGNRPDNTSLWRGRDMVEPGGPLAQARFTATTGALNLAGCRNVASVTRHGPGDYTITYSRPLKSSRNAYLASSNDLIMPAVVFTEQTDLVRVRIFNTAGSLIDPVGEMSIGVFGNRF
ncbi:hypothetical protein [Brevundimonas sp. RM1]